MFIWFVGLVAAAVLLSLAVLVHDREQNLRRDRESALTDSERSWERKRRAKRMNERLKLAATFGNGLGIAFIATSIFAPVAGGRALSGRYALLAVLIAIISHASAQYVLHFWKSEE